jgi:hypothetical protein
MKKTLAIFTSLMITSFALFAQDDGAFSKGTGVFNLGVGFGDVYWGGSYTSSFPVSPTLVFDYALTDKLGIGNIGVGATVAYSAVKYSNGDGTYAHYNGVLIGARGSYHFIIPNGSIKNKLDPYAGIMLGFVVTNYSNPNYVGTPFGGGKSSGFQPGIFAGAHYYFTGHFGVHGELGYNGFSILVIGITLKFP